MAVSHMITKGLVKSAIERDMPKSLEKQRPKLTQGDRVKAFQECINETGKILLEKDIEEVEIRSRDGLRLVGHWYPCENAKRVIVAMHGWRSAWYMDFGMIADFWHNQRKGSRRKALREPISFYTFLPISKASVIAALPLISPFSYVPIP